MQVPPLIIDFSDSAKKREFLTRAANLQGLWEIRMKERRFIRSLKSNDYYWAAVVDGLVQCMLAQGEVWSKDEAHEQLSGKLGLTYDKTMTNPKSGETETVILKRSTSTYTDQEMSDYITRCKIFLLDFFGYEVVDKDIFDLT